VSKDEIRSPEKQKNVFEQVLWFRSSFKDERKLHFRVIAVGLLRIQRGISQTISILIIEMNVLQLIHTYMYTEI